MDMSLGELQTLMECPKRYEISRLNLGAETRLRCWRKAVLIMCRLLEERKSVLYIKQQITGYLQSSYQSCWFPLPWQKKDAVESDAAGIHRYLDYIACECERLAEIKSNQRIWIEVNKDFGGRHIGRIYLWVHLILVFQDGRREAVIFTRKKIQQHSYGEKENTIKPEIHPEIAAAMYALRELENLRVSLIRFVPETGKETVDRNSGIEKVSFLVGEKSWSRSPAQIYQCFLTGIQRIPVPNCSKCEYYEICRIDSQKVYCLDRKEVHKLGAFTYADEQRKVIRQMEGNIRVSAGPGSGKTSVIVGRVKAMVHAGISANKILVLTYTREAAKELAGRMSGSQAPQICTIHSLAYQMLLTYPSIVGKKKLAEQLDKKILLLRVLKHVPRLQGMSYEGLESRYGLLHSLLKYFAFIDNNGKAKFQEVYWKKDVNGILWVKELYDSVFREAGYITYDEQISQAVFLLLENPGILKEQQQKYPYILVDEAQDLDGEQINLLRLLAGKTGNIMIVGDDDQAIFGFRGGSNEYMLRFKEYYPDAELLELGGNYRSSAEIVEVSNALISNNQNRIPKNMVSASGKCGIPCVHLEQFSDQQLPELLHGVKERLNCAWSDIAVLSKNNKELQKLCNILERHNKEADQNLYVPYERHKYYLREDAVFCGIYDLIVLKLRGMDKDLHLFRLLTNLGVSGIEKEDLEKSLYEDLCSRKAIYPLEADLPYYSIGNDDSPILQAFSKICKALTAFNLPDMYGAIRLAVHSLFADQHLDFEPILESIQELIFEKKIQTADELLELFDKIWFLKDSPRIRYSNGKNQVRFLTAHDAKGQQFQAVFIYAIDLFESADSDGKDREEERRLLYVAMTRAEKCLITAELIKGKSNFLRDFIDYVKVWR